MAQAYINGERVAFVPMRIVRAINSNPTRPSLGDADHVFSEGDV